MLLSSPLPIQLHRYLQKTLTIVYTRLDVGQGAHHYSTSFLFGFDFSCTWDSLSCEESKLVTYMLPTGAVSRSTIDQHPPAVGL